MFGSRRICTCVEYAHYKDVGAGRVKSEPSNLEIPNQIIWCIHSQIVQQCLLSTVAMNVTSCNHLINNNWSDIIYLFNTHCFPEWCVLMFFGREFFFPKFVKIFLWQFEAFFRLFCCSFRHDCSKCHKLQQKSQENFEHFPKNSRQTKGKSMPKNINNHFQEIKVCWVIL